MFLKATLCYIFTVGGIIKREHIPTQTFLGVKAQLTPLEAPSFQLSLQQGPPAGSCVNRPPRITAHISTSEDAHHQWTKALKALPPHLHMQVLRNAHTDTHGRLHTWTQTLETHLVNRHTVISQLFKPILILIGLCGLWESPVYWIWGLPLKTTVALIVRKISQWVFILEGGKTWQVFNLQQRHPKKNFFKDEKWQVWLEK